MYYYLMLYTSIELICYYNFMYLCLFYVFEKEKKEIKWVGLWGCPSCILSSFSISIYTTTQTKTATTRDKNFSEMNVVIIHLNINYINNTNYIISN